MSPPQRPLTERQIQGLINDRIHVAAAELKEDCERMAARLTSLTEEHVELAKSHAVLAREILLVFGRDGDGGYLKRSLGQIEQTMSYELGKLRSENQLQHEMQRQDQERRVENLVHDVRDIKSGVVGYKDAVLKVENMEALYKGGLQILANTDKELAEKAAGWAYDTFKWVRGTPLGAAVATALLGVLGTLFTALWVAVRQQYFHDHRPTPITIEQAAPASLPQPQPTTPQQTAVIPPAQAVPTPHESHHGGKRSRITSK